MNSRSSQADADHQSGEPLYTLEITGKDIAKIEAAKACIPAGTPINIAFLGNEDHGQRVNAARVIRSCGFEPVPIISSRRLHSEEDLDGLISNLVGSAAPSRFILVGGDPASPVGPYKDSLALLKSGVLERHSIRQVGIVAYPDGHPKIETSALWQALKWKVEFLRDAGCSVEITTQFGFDAAAVISWLKRLRDMGITSPVRIGVPGPADVAKLLRFAKQFGVVASASIARGYGLSLTDLLLPVGPERFWDQLGAGIGKYDLGGVLYHLYPFGGVMEGVRWINDHLPRR
ncbi:methylenetetrahydrofolate reductase [Rhizobium altiplani]|uniref:Methylenetetrahydrofolate reductase n=1 Tax=Rhizobium altiplani TaxID=1864509 RepID=A0A109K0M9_9HYPH|nr:methylenetetrahydrofolate reductase [Rhizobium altiplani]KWV58485.1 methylenetetrahydrofolate reductase [Rhizobium altiplani]